MTSLQVGGDYTSQRQVMKAYMGQQLREQMAKNEERKRDESERRLKEGSAAQAQWGNYNTIKDTEAK